MNQNFSSIFSNRSSILILSVITQLFFESHSLITSSRLNPNYGYDLIRRDVSLQAVSKRKLALVDGAEFVSLESFLTEEGTLEKPKAKVRRSNDSKKQGIMTIVTGTTKDQGQKVVGILASPATEFNENDFVYLDDNTYIYLNSMATIPNGVSEDDAISTLVASLTGVHCAIPRVKDVGGDLAFESYVSGKVIVVGGSDYAIFLADAISSIGGDVSLVSTGNPRPRRKNVSVIGPSVGELEVGFTDYVGTFYSLVDTIGDESEGSDIEYNNGNENIVLSQLRSVHKCERYISTVTQSQRVVAKEGILFGPKKAESYLSNSLSSASRNGSSDTFTYIEPPRNFGSCTLQNLLDNKVLFKSGQTKMKDMVSRGWSLKDFWESASWPRDSAGAGSTRFGLPVIDDISETEGYMISEAPLLSDQFIPEIPKDPYESGENPFVLEIGGLRELNEKILSPKKDCVLFLSAPFCRTCKKLSPQFTSFARKKQNSIDEDIIFAKAHATGPMGKDIGRSLNVDAVPTFVLFRKGEVYGEKLSISRIPSSQLDVAVQYLASGDQWDKEKFSNTVASDK